MDDTAPSSAGTRPAIRLKPKADARRLRRGFPWVFADQIVADRRTRALRPGTLVAIEDAERTALGLAAVAGPGQIAARMLDRDPAAVVDADWFAGRIAAATALRAPLHDSPHYRLIHAEGDGLPGLIVDRFGDVAVVQPNAAWVEARLDALVAALTDGTGITTVVKNAASRARAAEGLDDAGGVLAGTVDGPLDVPMNGAVYRADVLGGQKTGLYYDQRPNHAFVAGLARDGSVLDVFSHVGGFALAALAHGAASALALDSSAAALALAAEGAAATGVAEAFETREIEAVRGLEALASEGRTFDVVVCDPPAFAPAKPALDAGLRAYERIARRAAPLVAPGGYLTLCSCSHAAGLDAFRTASLRGIGRAGRAAQILRTGFAGPDHPQHPDLGDTGYLKALTFRLDRCGF